MLEFLGWALQKLMVTLRPAPPCPPASLTRGKDLFCTSLFAKQQGLEYVVTVSVLLTSNMTFTIRVTRNTDFHFLL